MNKIQDLRPAKPFLSRLCLLALLAVGAANTSSAALVYTLDIDACGGGCGTAPFGTVTLEQIDGNTVGVNLTLAPGVRFAGTNAGGALGFNVGGTVSINDVTSGFEVQAGVGSFSAFGDFAQWIDCTACQGGQDTNPVGPLTFTVSSANGLSVNDFGGNADGYFFASDIVGNGNTGNVGTDTAAEVVNTTPEPFSAALVGSGLTAAFLLRRRRSC